MTNRLYLISEFVMLYIGIPTVFYFDLIPIPKVAALLIVSLFTVLVLWFDGEQDFSHIFNRPDKDVSIRSLFLKSLAVAFTVTVLVMVLHPAGLFVFPRERPADWMVVMLLYPLISALPQELVYREFFFQRYRTLFPSEQMLGYANVAFFSALHIVYDNWWAILLSLIGGFMFVRTYRSSQSLYWVSVEHAVYGCLVFTIGMGQYFFEAF